MSSAPVIHAKQREPFRGQAGILVKRDQMLSYSQYTVKLLVAQFFYNFRVSVNFLGWYLNFKYQAYALTNNEKL